MAGALKHRFVSLLPDGSQAEQIQMQRDWNDDHVFGGSTTGGLLAFDSAQTDKASWIAPAASAGQFLRAGAPGALPAWSALTLPNTIAKGDLVVATAADVVGVVADVAAGSVLVSGGLGLVPAWSAAPSLTSLVLATPLGVASGGTGLGGTYTVGDLLYASGASALSALAAAAAGKILRATGTGAAPAWSTLTLPDTVTQGDLLTASAANVLSALADVAVGQVLVSGGVGAVPAWSASPTLTTLTLTAGTGTQTGKSPITIFTSTTSGSNTGVGETDLISYPMPANTLPVNGQKVRITVRGTLANNGDTKTLRLYFGGTAIAVLSGAGTSVWAITATVWRTGATAQLGFADQAMSGIAIWAPGANTTPAETLSGAVTIKITGQSNVGSNDATALAMLVEWLP